MWGKRVAALLLSGIAIASLTGCTSHAEKARQLTPAFGVDTVGVTDEMMDKYAAVACNGGTNALQGMLFGEDETYVDKLYSVLVSVYCPDDHE